MKNISYHENESRGTPDFPMSLYLISENDPKYHMRMHWHKDYELIHITSGSFHLTLNGISYDIKSGQSVFIPGGIIHSGTPDNCRYECIVFSASMLYSTQKCRSLIKSHIKSPVIYDQNRDIDDIFKLVITQPFGFELTVVSKLYSVVTAAFQPQPDTPVPIDKKTDKIKEAISLIEQNYNKKIALDDMARACHMSPNYFSRLFKDMTGETPFEYINNYRIEAACEMLASGSDSITEVCYSCGFNDLSYFIHIFKKHKGMSPKAYAKLF